MASIRLEIAHFFLNQITKKISLYFTPIYTEKSFYNICPFEKKVSKMVSADVSLFSNQRITLVGAATIGIMTLSKMTLSIMTLSITGSCTKA